MFKTILLAAVAVFSLAGAANAAGLPADVTITLGATDAYSLGGTITPNFNLGSGPTPIAGSGLSLTGGEIVAAGSSVPDVNTSPTGSLFGNSYLYVLGSDSSPGSNATFTLTQAANDIGLTWGTIDDYNTLTVTDAKGNVFAVTGTNLLAGAATAGISGLVAGTSQLNVALIDPFAAITSIVLTSYQNSFEAGNFSAAEVPVPPTFVLFALGLVALAGFAMVKKAGSQI
jgi:hypothetical protein